jgi:hypothetical protein
MAENADSKVDTRSTFHAARFWLKEAASLNIPDMSLTFAVFHAPMFWLNALA